MWRLQKNPDKLEQKALQYEQKGKTAKALKVRQKAAQLRQEHANTGATGYNPATAGLNRGPATIVTTSIIPVQTSSITTSTPTQIIAPKGTGNNAFLPGRSAAQYEANALKWEQRGNFAKAQKNREKAWRLNNPQYMNHTQVPSFYNNNQFLGYNAPITTTSGLGGAPIMPLSSGLNNMNLGGQTLHQQQNLSGQTLHQPQNLVGQILHQPQNLAGQTLHPQNLSGQTLHPQNISGQTLHPQYNTWHQSNLRQNKSSVGWNRDPQLYNRRAEKAERKGNAQKAQKLRAKAQALQGGSYQPKGNLAIYEQKAQRYEQEQNWRLAQNNRMKAWRLNNPQYNTYEAPLFYDNSRFLGYNVPLTHIQGLGGQQSFPGQQTYTTQSFSSQQSQPLSGQQYGYNQWHQSNLGPFKSTLGWNRDAQIYERKALRAEQKGNAQKAAKLRAKAHGITSGTYQSKGNMSSYEQKALRYEQQGNWRKAQQNRSKAWRLRNPQHHTTEAPIFYDNSRFLGYEVPLFGQSFGQQQFTSSTITSQRVVGAPIVETVTRATIVEQTSRPERIVEVQPIIHREIDAPEVRIIEQHSYENVRSTGPSTTSLAPIVQETVHQKITEEVQPIIHREVPAPYIERVEEHITEHVVQPTITTKQVIQGGTTAVGGFSQSTLYQPTYTTWHTTNLKPYKSSIGWNSDHQKYLVRAEKAERKGNAQKAAKLRAKAQGIQSGTYKPKGNLAKYEQNALRHEQEKNWQRAQHNRMKAWRLNNPQYNAHEAPLFYDNGQFLGYNVPLSHIQQGQSGIPAGGNIPFSNQGNFQTTTRL